MELEKINIKEVLITIKHRILSAQQVYFNTEEIERRLRQAKIYDDELVLLRIFKERVEHKTNMISGEIKKNGARRYDRTDESSETFKKIPIDKVKNFIRQNDFTQSKYSTIEQVIGDLFYDKFLK